MVRKIKKKYNLYKTSIIMKKINLKLLIKSMKKKNKNNKNKFKPK